MDTIYWFLAQVGSVVVVSKDLKKIITTTEILRTIIYPFEYQDPYVLPLPKTYANYLGAPFPCLIGMPISSEEEVFKIAKASYDFTLIVNLDKDQLLVSFDSDIHTTEEFRQLPDPEEGRPKAYSK